MDGPCKDHGRTTGLHPFGYVYIKRGGHLSLHREAYAHHHGLSAADIKGKVVRHECDNPRCINPRHLEIGTHADNMRDQIERGRRAKVKDALRHLTDEQAEFIRRTAVPRHRELGFSALARQLGTNHGTVRDVFLGRTYR